MRLLAELFVLRKSEGSLPSGHLNPTYRDLAEHYGVAIIPARPYRPRDKAYVSYCTLSGVRNVESWLLSLPPALAL